MIAVATILSGLAMSELLGRPHCFAMMEPFLPRLLSRSGLVVHRAGTEVEYHGQRSPYFFETAENVQAMAPELKDFYLAIRASFAASKLSEPKTARERAGALRAPGARSSWVQRPSGPQYAF